MNLGIFDIMIKGRRSMKDTLTPLNNRVKGTFIQEICFNQVQSLLRTIKVEQMVYLFWIICRELQTKVKWSFKTLIICIMGKNNKNRCNLMTQKLRKHRQNGIFRNSCKVSIYLCEHMLIISLLANCIYIQFHNQKNMLYENKDTATYLLQTITKVQSKRKYQSHGFPSRDYNHFLVI